MNKYTYLFVLQGQYNHGWEDLTAAETWKEIAGYRKDYRENEGGVYRIVKRREPNMEGGT